MSDSCCGGRCATGERRAATMDEPDGRTASGPGSPRSGAGGFNEHYCTVHDFYYCAFNHDDHGAHFDHFKSAYNYHDDGPIYDLDSTHYDYHPTYDHDNGGDDNHYRWWM